MTVYEPDPDVVRWNLHLIDVCGINNGGSLGTVTQYDWDFSQLGYVREGYSEPMHVNVENDEVIAHALQEELSRLPLEESIGSSHTDEEHQKVSVLAQDWLAPSRRNYNFALDGTDSNGMSTSSNWEHQANSPEIEDESLLDGEVGKRLNQLAAIPHVPKINGDIPSVDEAKSDHQRLMDRLEVYDLVELKVSGDGNCQFHSLSDQIYRSTEHHKFVREQVVKQLKSHRELYEGYVPMAYDEYLKKMSKAGEWGDHVTLQAAADSYGVKIFVITSFKDTCYIEILPQRQKSTRIIFLSFWAEVHYNSIYPQGASDVNLQFPESSRNLEFLLQPKHNLFRIYQGFETERSTITIPRSSSGPFSTGTSFRRACWEVHKDNELKNEQSSGYFLNGSWTEWGYTSSFKGLLSNKIVK